MEEKRKKLRKYNVDRLRVEKLEMQETKGQKSNPLCGCPMQR
jgi:hypothetical protein